jgi:hypothetical protein
LGVLAKNTKNTHFWMLFTPLFTFFLGEAFFAFFRVFFDFFLVIFSIFGNFSYGTVFCVFGPLKFDGFLKILRVFTPKNIKLPSDFEALKLPPDFEQKGYIIYM